MRLSVRNSRACSGGSRRSPTRTSSANTWDRLRLPAEKRAEGAGKGGDSKEGKEKAAKKGGDKAEKKPKDDKKGGEKADKKGDKADKKGDKTDKKGAGDKPKKADDKKKDEGKAKPQSNEDLLDELEKPQKKAKNPLDDLPESAMSMDATKKLFFNQKPCNPNFFAEFWGKFDDKGYSLFTCNYKDNQENKVYWMTCNLVGGFLQRAEDCRKYAFGVMNVCGKDEDTAPFSINGAWLFRGPDIIKEMREVPDSEYFEWKKVDPKSAAGKAAIEKLFTGANPADKTDDKLLERRYFK